MVAQHGSYACLTGWWTNRQLRERLEGPGGNRAVERMQRHDCDKGDERTEE